MAILPSSPEKRAEFQAGDLADKQALAERAYQLITKWKTIPGLKAKGEVDIVFLKGWIESVRTLAKENDRERIAEAMIGSVFAKYPEPEKGEGLYPAKEICEVIEDLNSDRLLNNFRV